MYLFNKTAASEFDSTNCTKVYCSTLAKLMITAILLLKNKKKILFILRLLSCYKQDLPMVLLRRLSC